MTNYPVSRYFNRDKNLLVNKQLGTRQQEENKNKQ
jgi:hypothetical protein